VVAGVRGVARTLGEFIIPREGGAKSWGWGPASRRGDSGQGHNPAAGLQLVGAAEGGARGRGQGFPPAGAIRQVPLKQREAPAVPLIAVTGGEGGRRAVTPTGGLRPPHG